MPKPKTKTELIDQSQNNYERLMTLVESYSEAEANAIFPAGTLNRNIRDVLAHLHHWHLLLLDWYIVGMKRGKPEMPAPGFTWKTMPALNKEIWTRYQNVELNQVKTLLDDSYNKVQKLILQHTDKELFEKKKYKWTGSTSLGVYLISNSSSHYAWAIKLIKKAKKKRPQ